MYVDHSFTMYRIQWETLKGYKQDNQTVFRKMFVVVK